MLPLLLKLSNFFVLLISQVVVWHLYEVQNALHHEVFGGWDQSVIKLVPEFVLLVVVNLPQVVHAVQDLIFYEWLAQLWR